MTAVERAQLWIEFEEVVIDSIQTVVDNALGGPAGSTYDNRDGEDLGKKIVQTARRLADIELTEMQRNALRADTRKAAIIAHERRKRYGR